LISRFQSNFAEKALDKGVLREYLKLRNAGNCARRSNTRHSSIGLSEKVGGSLNESMIRREALNPVKC